MHRETTRVRLVLAMLFALGCCYGQTARADLLGVDFNSGTLYSVSETNAALTPLGNTGITSFAAIEFAPSGTLYGFTAGSSTLYTINPLTAATSPVGPLGLSFVFEGGLAFAPNGTAYGTNSDSNVNPQLFSLNLTTGSATIIGTISGGNHDINGLAYRGDGNLIGLDRESNSLLVINPVTAASSVLNAVPTTVGAVGGMAVLNGVGYYNTGGPGGSIPGSNLLYSFDLFTGASTLVGSFAPTITGTGISGLAAIPEPDSIVLALVGCAGLFGFSRRWRSKFSGVMRRMKGKGNSMRLLLTFVACAALSGSAIAAPIVFVHTGKGSGTIDETPFSDADFTITAIGVTENREFDPPDVFWIDHNSAWIEMSGLGLLNFVTATRTFVNQSSPIVGFSRAGDFGADLYNGPTNDAFATWDMLSSIGPFNGTANLLQWLSAPVVTDAGVLVFTSGSSDATFQATVVPEPASAFPMMIGIFALGLRYCARRRRERAFPLARIPKTHSGC